MSDSADKTVELADNSIKLTVPVMICTFTRLDSAIKVFESVRKAAPPRLYLVSDGPRADHPDDADKIAAVHDYIEGHIDWDCEVFKNYAEENMGCGLRMPTGVSWVFEHEERAIFLEDDCVPRPSFYQYVQELLERYENDENVMLISGNNQISYLNTIGDSYGFVKQAGTWGWASWRRAWEKYDINLTKWPDNRNNPCWKKYYSLSARLFMFAQWDLLYNHGYDAWDYQVKYCLGANDGYCIMPSVNMVSNVGFEEEGSTHTSQLPEWMDQHSEDITFPLRHPKEIVWAEQYDREFMKREFKSGYIVRIKQLLGLNINKSVFEQFGRNNK